MKNLRDKLLTAWAPLVAAAAVMVVAMPLLLLYVLNLTRSLRASVDDPLKMLIAISTTGVVLTATLAMFCVGRWFQVSDRLAETSHRLQALEAGMSGLASETHHLAGQGQATGETLARLLQAQGAQVVPDTTAVWSNLTHHVWSYNSLLKGETKGSPRTGYAVDPERLDNFVQRLTAKQMLLTYIVFLPRGASLGPHVEPLVRLCTIVKAVRERAAAMGQRLASTPRVFVVDAPRPSSSFFLTARTQGGVTRPIALEYFRSYEPGAIDTPTADRMLVEHSSAAQIEHLTYFYDEKLKASHEVAWQDVEDIVGPMLAGWTNADAESATQRIYESAAGNDVETIVNADHFVMTPVAPSRQGVAPKARGLGLPAPAAVSLEAKGSWSSALSASLRSIASRLAGNGRRAGGA